MRAGQLRHRLIIQSATVTQSDSGEPVETWREFAEVWGGLRPLTQRERASVRQPFAEADYVVPLRYRNDLTPRMRLVYGTRVFDILGADDPDDRGRELALYCRERNL
jgi:SPP1 family predicted phage head-tail adaptor